MGAQTTPRLDQPAPVPSVAAPRPPRGGGALARLLRLDSPVLSLPAVGLVVVGFFVPLGVLAVYSLWPTVQQVVVHEWTLSNYERFFSESVYWRSLLRSFVFVGIASGLTVALALPLAYFVAVRVAPSRRLWWILVAILPFWTSYLIRVFSWMNLLGDDGVINTAVAKLGLGGPLPVFGFDKYGIVLTFVYLLFPLSFLTAYIAIERMNPAVLEAAADLGAKPWQGLARITLPIARTGLIGGFVFCFISMMGDYITPQLIGGTEGYLYSNLITNQFGASVRWGFGSALALILALTVFLLLVLMRLASGGGQQVGEYTRTFTPRRTPVLRTYALGFMAFLYAPIALLVLFAFNDSDAIGFPIQGLTTHWFTAVFDDTLLMDSLQTSLTVAFFAVGISTVLGTLAAIQLARSAGRWRSMSLAILAVPLFLPPLLLGLAIIIGLNALGVERGLWTIIVGHTILTLPIVTLMVVIRLEGLDLNQELAAMDLGARPWQALLRISVPQALPGIVAAALVAFAVSMDEFILTYLVTGSDSTLPLYIFGALRFEITPKLAAVSSLLLGLSFALVLLGAIIARGGARKGRRGGAAGPLALDIPTDAQPREAVARA